MYKAAGCCYQIYQRNLSWLDGKSFHIRADVVRELTLVPNDDQTGNPRALSSILIDEWQENLFNSFVTFKFQVTSQMNDISEADLASVWELHSEGNRAPHWDDDDSHIN